VAAGARVVEPLAVDHAVYQALLGPRAGLGAGEPSRALVAIFILIVHQTVLLHGLGSTANVRAVRAATALVDWQAGHGRPPWGWELAWLAGRVSPRPLKHLGKSLLAGVVGAGRGVAWMVGTQVGKQGLGWDRVLAAGGRADPETVGRVVEE
jgi:hypothetical protein